jgi:hypothetical protein
LSELAFLKNRWALATLVVFCWAVVATSGMAWYYAQMVTCSDQLGDKETILNDMLHSHNKMVEEYNVIATDYSDLYGTYHFFPPWPYNLTSIEFDNLKGNYSNFLTDYNKLLNKLDSTYGDLLNQYSELNGTCNELMKHYNELMDRLESYSPESRAELINDITVDFKELLIKYGKLHSETVIKAYSGIMGNLELKVDLCIDYGNGTVIWFNATSMPVGSTLFDLLQKEAVVDYNYWAMMEPGHMLVTSINGLEQNYTTFEYWFWYYWDAETGKWVHGLVGCDAWKLKNDGIYKWAYEIQSFP